MYLESSLVTRLLISQFDFFAQKAKLLAEKMDLLKGF